MTAGYVADAAAYGCALHRCAALAGDADLLAPGLQVTRRRPRATGRSRLARRCPRRRHRAADAADRAYRARRSPDQRAVRAGRRRRWAPGALVRGARRRRLLDPGDSALRRRTLDSGRPAAASTSCSIRCSISTTTLDPYFNIAYRFGAIFLGERYPGGPGRPDQAVALLARASRHARRSGSTTTTSRSSILAAARLQGRGRMVPARRDAAERAQLADAVAASMLTSSDDRRRPPVLWQQTVALGATVGASHG